MDRWVEGKGRAKHNLDGSRVDGWKPILVLGTALNGI